MKRALKQAMHGSVIEPENRGHAPELMIAVLTTRATQRQGQ